MCALHATRACHTVEVRPQATAEVAAAAVAATRAKVSRLAKPDNYFSCQHCAT